MVFDRYLGAREALTERSFRDLRLVEEGSFWFRARNRLIVWALAHYFPRAASFLEVGCGTGFVLKAVRTALPHLKVAGGELGMAGLRSAHERVPDVPLYALDAGRLPFANEFDVLGAFDVIEHLDDDEAVLSQFRTALRGGGGLLLTVPQHQWLWSPADNYSGHRRRYTRVDLSAKLIRAGFRIIRVTSFVSLLLPLLAISRLAQRRRESFDPLGEFRISPPLDRVLEGIQGVELALLARGLSFRAGGSLFIAAIKES